MELSKTYCGYKKPENLYFIGEIRMLFRTSRWMAKRGFILYYEIEGKFIDKFFSSLLIIIPNSLKIFRMWRCYRQ